MRMLRDCQIVEWEQNETDPNILAILDERKQLRKGLGLIARDTNRSREQLMEIALETLHQESLNPAYSNDWRVFYVDPQTLEQQYLGLVRGKHQPEALLQAYRFFARHDNARQKQIRVKKLKSGETKQYDQIS